MRHPRWTKGVGRLIRPSWLVSTCLCPRQDAQRIMILDIRLCNQDRHAGNILVSDGDHGVLGELGPVVTTQDSTPIGPPPAPFELRRSHSVGPSLERMHTSRPLIRDAFSSSARTRTLPKHLDRDGLCLIPIDHGFALPHPLAIDETELSWLCWVSGWLVVLRVAQLGKL